MWPGGVVVRLVSGQDGVQVLLAEDQHAVQKLAAQGPARHSQIPFMRGAWTAVRKILVRPAWNTASDEAVKSEPRSRVRNLMSPNPSPIVRERLRAC
jgi:hypothetical protein